MTGRTRRLLRRPGKAQPVTLLELFFDLAFVFALTQLSRTLIDNLTWSGAYQTLVLLLAVLWVWTLTAWVTDRLDPEHPAVQAVVLATMVGGLVMGAALAESFGRHGLVFAAVATVIHLGVMLFLILALSGPERRTGQRLLFWAAATAGLWLSGGIVGGTARAALWGAAAAVDYIAFALRFPTPGLGRVVVEDWPLVAEHLADRHRQLFIIALGELILVAGLTFSQGDLDADRSAAFGASILTTVLVWRIYVYRAGELVDEAITASADPIRLTRPVALAHLIMVAGVVVTAVGDELVIAQPLGRTHPAWIAVLHGGPALFIVGRARLEHAVFGRVSANRSIALLALLALTPPMLFLPPLGAAVAVAAVLGAVTGSDAYRARRRPAAPPLPIT